MEQMREDGDGATVFRSTAVRDGNGVACLFLSFTKLRFVKEEEGRGRECVYRCSGGTAGHQIEQFLVLLVVDVPATCFQYVFSNLSMWGWNQGSLNTPVITGEIANISSYPSCGCKILV